MQIVSVYKFCCIFNFVSWQYGVCVLCENTVQELNLYAEFNGRTLPASQSISSDKFQVSHLMCLLFCYIHT